MTDEARAAKWFARLRRVLKDMPRDCEVMVSASGCVTLMPEGSFDDNPKALSHGLDLLADEYGIGEFRAERLYGENSTV